MSVRPRRKGGRTLACLAVVAALAGLVLVVLGVGVARSDADVVLEVAPATAASAPSTVAPRPALGEDDATVRAEPSADVPAQSTTVPPATTPRGPTIAAERDTEGSESSLAELLGPSWSAIPPAVEPRSIPSGIQIGSIDVSRFPIRPIGLEPDGQLEIPDETEIGWYRHGATAGEEGATVLAAHVSWNGTNGPFARLGSVEPGDQIEIRGDDGGLRRYEVVERAIYGKLELPKERIWRRSGPESLVLITCGGEFNPTIRRFEQNIVVYAVPIG